MEVSFSAKPQILTLISCTPLSPLSRPLRREFLGSGHNLRPPGCLRSRRRRRDSSSSSSRYDHYQSRSSRFVLRASLGSQSVLVVVAVVSVSAASFVFWNYFNSKKNDRELSTPADFALPQMGGNVMNHVIKSQMIDFADENIENNTNASVDTETALQFHSASLVDKETLVCSAVESSSSNVLVSDSGSPTFVNTSSVLNQSLSPLVSEPVILEPHHLSQKLNGVQIEKLREEIESGFGGASLNGNSSVHSKEEFLSGFGSDVVMKGPKVNGAFAQESDSLVEMREQETEIKEVGEEAETVTDNFYLGESVREELHVFYDETKSDEKQVAKINGHKPSSPLNSITNSVSLSLRNSILNGTDASARLPHIKENVEGKIPFASSKEGSLPSKKDLSAGRGDSRGGKNGILAQYNQKALPQMPRLNGLDVDEKYVISEKISVYTNLLNDGRLSDAIKVLEDMERRGCLDMDKVYHGRFFKMCKTKKAVREAFRFTKLITSPTLSTYNMLMSICASSQDAEGAFQVLQLVREAGLKADCKLYTTLISTCAKSGKVDTMFEVFHKMVNEGVEPNLHTYGALIDGCAKAGQVAKAFGAYGIMSSKNVKPDRVVFNALITACGQSGAVDRAFDVLAEMAAEINPIDPDHVTVGALMKACANAGQVDRVREVYKMLHRYKIKGTPEVYTIAVNSCSETGNWDFARSVYDDMTRNGVVPDEMFLSALIDAAGQSGKLDAAFKIIQEAKNQGLKVGTVSYSSLMGACSNAKNWKKALELYENLRSIKLKQTVSTVNALITALCDGDQLPKAMEVLSEMKSLGLSPNSITYSILLVASERKDDLETGLTLLSQAKNDGVSPNLVMSRCLIGMCLRRYQRACMFGEPVLSLDSGQPQVNNKWTSSALMVYREMIVSGVVPSIDVLSQVLGCLQLPHDASLKNRLIENLGVSSDSSRPPSNLCSLIDGFGEYDPRAFSLLEEAASLGIVSCVSFKQSPVVVDTRDLHVHASEVYILTVLKGLKHRLAAGAKLPSVTILLPVEPVQFTPQKGERKINVAGRVGLAVAALLRRIRLPYQGNESYGKIKIYGLSMRRWFEPKLASSSPFGVKPEEINFSQFRPGKGIAHQQRDIRTGTFSLDSGQTS